MEDTSTENNNDCILMRTKISLNLKINLNLKIRYQLHKLYSAE
jgi:hypothetical protein